MPAEDGSTTLGLDWFGFQKDHRRYASKRSSFFMALTEGGRLGGPPMLWDGDRQTNTNAALTVFRHFDSATVVRGLVGAPPKTAWVIDYALLERIHYLLVAGYDVYGNISHQLVTRMYMDFLRMEGEAGFMSMLPMARRKPLVDFWYRGVHRKAMAKLVTELTTYGGPPPQTYASKTPELELFEAIRTKLGAAVDRTYALENVQDASVRRELERLERVQGVPASLLSEISFVTLQLQDGRRRTLSVLRDSAHSNVDELFREDKRRLPKEDRLSVVPGFLGAYPNAMYLVKQAELAAFVDAVAALDSPAAYRALRARFGVLRASARFWPHSDQLAEERRKDDAIYGGLFDFSRLEAY